MRLPINVYLYFLVLYFTNIALVQKCIAFDEKFYKQPDLRGSMEQAVQGKTIEAMDVLNDVKESPELLNELRALLLGSDNTKVSE